MKKRTSSLILGFLVLITAFDDLSAAHGKRKRTSEITEISDSSDEDPLPKRQKPEPVPRTPENDKPISR